MKVREKQCYKAVFIGNGSWYSRVHTDGSIYHCASGDAIPVVTEMNGKPTGKDANGYPIWEFKRK